MNDFIVALICGIIIIGTITLALFGDSVSCDSEWRDSGFSHRWSAMGGCQIQFSNGVWIPAKNYRGV